MTPRRIVACIVLAALLLVVVLVLSLCSTRREIAASNASQTIATGRTGAAQDASGIRDRADTRTAEIDATVKDGTDAIRSAPDRVSANAAALRSLCRLNPGADARCRVLNADPQRVD